MAGALIPNVSWAGLVAEGSAVLNREEVDESDVGLVLTAPNRPPKLLEGVGEVKLMAGALLDSPNLSGVPGFQVLSPLGLSPAVLLPVMLATGALFRLDDFPNKPTPGAADGTSVVVLVLALPKMLLPRAELFVPKGLLLGV